MRTTDSDATTAAGSLIRPLFEQFQLVGDGIDRLLGQLVPSPRPS